MLSRFLIFTLCALSAFSIETAHASSVLTINLEKRHSLDTDSQAQWFVEYASENKVRKIYFNNSSNFSRTTRWSSVSEGFEIVTEGEHEIIQRNDGAEFDRIEFELTPSYTHLPKNHAPFSPLSDGGMIFNSGRFFACTQICDNSNDQWDLTLMVPPKEFILLNGELIVHSAKWQDTKDGRSVYVGKQKPVLSSGVLTLVDQGLPTEIRESLHSDIPKLMEYFESKLGKLQTEQTPTLFASYSNKPGTSSQGGVLPNQIFMHWDFDDLEKKVKKQEFLNETLFYFAHEVAHFFQTTVASAINDEAWVHEGSADYFSLNALSELYPEAQGFAEAKQLDSKNKCESSLNDRALSEASDNGDFKAHYYCGLLIHQRIAKEIAKADEHITLSILWKDYRREVQSGKPAGQETFLSILNHYSNDDFSNKIRAFINNRHSNPSIALNQLSK